MAGNLETNNDLLSQILAALGGDGATGIDDLNAAIGTPSRWRRTSSASAPTLA